MLTEQKWWVTFNDKRKNITKISTRPVKARNGETMFTTSDPLCRDVLRSNPKKYSVVWSSKDANWTIASKEVKFQAVKSKTTLKEIPRNNDSAIVNVTIKGKWCIVELDKDAALSEIGIEGIAYLESNPVRSLDIFLIRNNDLTQLEQLCYVNARELVRDGRVMIKIYSPYDPKTLTAYTVQLFSSYNLTIE